MFKALVVPLAVLPVYRSVRVALHTALSLAALGELSFVLARFAQPLGLLPPEHAEGFVAVGVLTMLASPFLIHAAPALSAWAVALLGSTAPTDEVQRERGPQPRADHRLRAQRREPGARAASDGLAVSHLGAGSGAHQRRPQPRRTGALRRRDAPGGARRGRRRRRAGHRRRHLRPVATRRIVALARQSNPHVPIIVRTRYVAEMDDLRRLGATEVIPEEFETSVEIFARVLRRLRVPRNVIALQVDLIRQQGYSMLRGLELPRQTLDQLGDILAATTTESFMVPRVVADGRAFDPRPATAQTDRSDHHRRRARWTAADQSTAGLGDPGRGHPGDGRQPRPTRPGHGAAGRDAGDEASPV